MKNLNALFAECKMELDSINMDYSRKIVSIKVNNRLRTTMGICHRNRSTGNYTIDINPALLADSADVREVKDTIIHEIIHTCPGCFNHGVEWKMRGDLVNRKLGYNISRCADRAEVEAKGIQLKVETYKYALECVECGQQYKYKRWTSALEYPSKYRCGSCHGNFKVVCLDGSRDVLGIKVANASK